MERFITTLVLLGAIAAGCDSATAPVQPNTYLELDAVGGVVFLPKVLTAIREGNTNKAMSLLELRLDSEFITLCSVILEAGRFNPETRRAYHSYKRYRLANPQKEVDPELARILSQTEALLSKQGSFEGEGSYEQSTHHN